MKKLLVLLFSLFFLSSPSVFADDISDFQIEGMSIGDSLLDYMTEEEILEEIEITKNHYSYLNEPNKYAEVYLFANLQRYDSIGFLIKNTATSQYVTNKNEEYTIFSIRGLIDFNHDFDGCLQKRNEIAQDLSKLFSNVQKLDNYYVSSDQTITDKVYFEFSSGNRVEVSCIFYDETRRVENNWINNLSVSIDKKEIISWLQDQ